MEVGVNGRIFQIVLPVVVQPLKNRADLAVNQLLYVVDCHALVLIIE